MYPESKVHWNLVHPSWCKVHKNLLRVSPKQTIFCTLASQNRHPRVIFLDAQHRVFQFRANDLVKRVPSSDIRWEKAVTFYLDILYSRWATWRSTTNVCTICSTCRHQRRSLPPVDPAAVCACASTTSWGPMWRGSLSCWSSRPKRLTISLWRATSRGRSLRRTWTASRAGPTPSSPSGWPSPYRTRPGKGPDTADPSTWAGLARIFSSATMTTR